MPDCSNATRGRAFTGRSSRHRGHVPVRRRLTLVELVMASVVVGILTVGAAALLDATLQAHEYALVKSNGSREGFLLMERLTRSLRTTSAVFIPNAQRMSAEVLAFAAGINNDGDTYFGDPLFPRVDEDPKKELTDDGEAGILGYDDDGDGEIDEGGNDDDDEDGAANEDPFDGLDNDADGNVDEDPHNDANGDDKSGIRGVDDDGDGLVDEDDKEDDDEDGVKNEDGAEAVIYTWNSATSTLRQIFPHAGTNIVLSTNVTHFRAYCPAPERVLIELTVTDSQGGSVAFSEYVCPRNVRQYTGRRTQ